MFGSGKGAGIVANNTSKQKTFIELLELQASVLA